MPDEPKFTKTTTRNVLTEQDLVCLQLAADGLRPHSIAARMTPPTNRHAVGVRMYRITEKLGVPTVTGAACAALRKGLIR